jgi:predicted nucleic acid-binding protein
VLRRRDLPASLPRRKPPSVSFFQKCPTYPLDDDVIERTVKLRQQEKMKLGDAIIAATALEFGLPLVTRNVDDFKHMVGLRVINPFDSAAAPQP